MNDKMYIHVRVKTKAKTEKVYTQNQKFFIDVKEKAERGAANKRVKELLASLIGCNIKQLRLIKGATTPSKTFIKTN